MLNKVQLIGRIGQDPELKYTQSGSAVCNISLATTETWKDKSSGQKQEKTEWHRIVVFGKGAEILNQYTGKGSQLYVEGKLQTRSWEDDKGNKRYTTEIFANDFKFLSKKSESGESQPQAQNDYNVNTDANFASDDIPF